MGNKILVVGTGFLGENLIEQYKEKNTCVIGTNYQNLKNDNIFLDITNLDLTKKTIEKLKPDVVINCAANTNLDYIESNSDVGFLINSHGPKNLAKVCHKNKIKLIHISTDSVFDGKKDMSYTEEDIPNPINIYSKSKLMGEKLIMENSSNHIIIRTNFFGFNKNGKFLLNSILKILSKKEKFVGFDDVFFNPLEITNLNEMIIELSNSNFTGIINLASNKVISKYEFAIDVAKIFDLNYELIRSGSIDDFEFIAKRPKNTSLSNIKAKRILKTKIISVQDSLRKIKENHIRI